MRSREVTVVVHIDGDPNSRTFRVPLWAFEVGKWGAVTVALLVVLFFAFAEPLTRAAARVPGLEQEMTRLRQENGRVQQLARALNRAEANYQELRQLLSGGGAVAAGAVQAAGAKPGPELMRAARLRARAPLAPERYAPGPSEPTHWPVDVGGMVTPGEARPGEPLEAHPGIDIAVPVRSAVRAAGGGTVERAGADVAYGLFVRVRHPDGYETLYEHASRLLVHDGDSVQAGQVIAFSGSTGRSTAPHLHFEIRQGGKSLDPLTMVKQEN